MNNAVHFSIKYDGPALAAHQMDVRELAPALFALSELLEQANKAAYPDAPEVRVSVNGDFKGGSFGVDLIAVQTIAQQVVAMLGGPNATAAANLTGILGGIGFLGGGLISVIKWLKGRSPSSVRYEGDKTIFEIRTEETIETMEADLMTGRLYRTRVVRQALAKVIRPLAREGIDTFFCGLGGRVAPLVQKADVPYFDAAASEADVVSDTTAHSVLLQIESAVFKDGNKWRLSDGEKSFFAEIADADFVARVESGAARFGKGDILVVDLRKVQTVTDAGLRTDSTVTRVLDHRAPLQAGLFPAG